MNIIKYLVINNVNVTEKSLMRAVQSGSEEVIEFLASKDYSVLFEQSGPIQFLKATSQLYKNVIIAYI